MRTVEIVFYCHGVMPAVRGRDHTDDYTALHEGIIDAFDTSTLWPTEFGGAEWGWNYDRGVAESHKALADAQRVFGDKVLAISDNEWDFSLNPVRWVVNRARPLVFHGFGDMFYYVSTDGKWAVRYEAAVQLHAHIMTRVNSGDAISLTLLGHSAGSVILFDLLFYLFSSTSSSLLKGGTSRFATSARLQKAHAAMTALQALVSQGRLRLRRFITFGSPISLLMCRSDFLVETLAAGLPVSPADYGLTSTLAGTQVNGPRWINLWDKDDPIAWPVAPVMESDLVEDVYVDVADWDKEVHSQYWTSAKCHAVIAERW